MQIKIKNPFSFTTSIFFVVVMFVLQFNSFNIQSNKNPYPISWDVYGYYLYLPATFIYEDLSLEQDSWIDETREKYNPSSTFYQVKNGDGNKKIIIYNCGYSFIYAPGFFLANSLASTYGFEKDGFSKPYQLSLLFTALLISIIGIIMLRKIALYFFSDVVASLALIIILFGTNYFYQAVFDGVMPHNILFTINCFILWYTIKWHKNKSLKNIVILSGFIGLATLCRPTELLWLLIPLFWNVTSKKIFFEKLKYLFKNYIQIIGFTVVLISILFIQLLYNKYASGVYFSLNLHSEGFSFLSPYTFDFLFSYKKGWLIYTPIMILGLVGFYNLWKQKQSIWFSLSIFFIINLYVLSSWECWWYASSFGARPMVESYVMMLLPLGFFINWFLNLKNWAKIGLGVLVFGLIAFNLFQIWQFKKGFIHGEQMTKEYYWNVFGKTSPKGINHNFLSPDRSQSIFEDYDNYQYNYYKVELYSENFEEGHNQLVDTLKHEGEKSFVIDKANPYSPAFEEKYYDITSKSYFWVRASAWVYLTAPYSESNSCIVISTEAKNKSYKYVTSSYGNFNVKPFEWTQIHLDYITPDIRHKNDKLKIYFWNMGDRAVIIDEFKVEAFIPKNDYK